MRKAIDVGCRSPIVYFLLGYNQFELAAQLLMDAGGELDGLDRETYEAIVYSCTDAAWSFGRGLRDEPFDAQIYYWIGFVAETLGAGEKALDAYRRAVKADFGFAPVCAEKQEALVDGGDAARQPPYASHALNVCARNIAEILRDGE